MELAEDSKVQLETLMGLAKENQDELRLQVIVRLRIFDLNIFSFPIS